MQTRTGRGTARQPSEAPAAVRGASRCHRRWAPTAALEHHARARGVRVRGEGVRCRCRVTSSGGPCLLQPLLSQVETGLVAGGPERSPVEQLQFERPAPTVERRAAVPYVHVARRPLGRASYEAALAAASVWLRSGSAGAVGAQLEAARFPYRFRAASNGYPGRHERHDYLSSAGSAGARCSTPFVAGRQPSAGGSSGFADGCTSGDRANPWWSC
jgi:hypothetical protein